MALAKSKAANVAKAKDAWEQFQDLRKKFTQEVEVRKDIVVTARALDRGVELRLRDKDWHDKGPVGHSIATGPRNIKTMRELAQAILDACDFVESSNPEWASRIQDTTDPFVIVRAEKPDA